MEESGIKLTQNGKNVLIHLNKVPQQFQSACRQGLFQTGKLLLRTVSAGILHSEKSGKYYNYLGRNKRASAPGEFSANRSGALRKSYDIEIEGYKKLHFGSDLDYALFIEEGTYKMKPRENLGQSVRQTEHEVLQLLSNTLDAEIKR